MLINDNDLKRLISFIEHKLSLLNEVLEISKNQAEVIANENIDRLNDLIASKQLRMNKIDKVDRQMHKIFIRIRSNYGIQKIEELKIDTIQLFFNKINEILLEIYEIDKKNSELAHGKYEEIKGKLKNAKKEKKVASKYYTVAAQTGGYFIDNKK